MPVFLSVRRVAVCAICNGKWYLEANESPEKCVHCGSGDWELGPESRERHLIRQGISRLRRSLNPGATSKKRQDWGKKQYQSFRPKPEDSDAAS